MPPPRSAPGVDKQPERAAPAEPQAKSAPQPASADKPSPAAKPTLEPEHDLGSEVDPAASPRRTAKRRPAGPPRAHVAANDDLPSIGGLIFALHQKPSRFPMKVAAIASGVWAFCGVLLGWAMLAPEIQRAPTLLEMLTRPTAITLAATIILPIAIFWFIALLVSRADDLKNMSSTMTEVAIRLAEPDRMAEQQVASVGQAVRRQVNHMNEAVSRALGRAGELEALVHNEVASLERSYTQNENRIRGLLEELAGERTALLNTSERVSYSLKELGTDIPMLIDKLGDQQVKLARFIEQAGQNIVGLEQSLASSASQLAASVGDRTEHLKGVLSEQTASLQGLLDHRTGEIAAALSGGVGRIENALGGQTDAIENRLIGHANSMQAVFDSFAGGLDNALGHRTDQMRQVLEGTSEGIDRALEQRTTDIQRTLESTVSQIDKSLGQRTEGLQATLEEYTRALDATMAARQHSLEEHLVERTKALDDAFSERLKHFDDAIVRSTIAIDSTVADKARALSSALENHAGEIAQVLGRQAGQMDEQIMHGVHAVRRASENVTKQSVKAIEGLAGQAELLRNLSDNLVNQISSVTNRFDAQGQTIMRAASALETANQRIDQNLQHRQADLARTLEDLSSRADSIDKVMRGYPEALKGSVNEFESRARQANEDLARTAQERSLAARQEMERLKAATASETEQAVADFRSKFQNVSREVNAEIGTLQSRFTQSYDEIRKAGPQHLCRYRRRSGPLAGGAGAPARGDANIRRDCAPVAAGAVARPRAAFAIVGP